MLHSWIRDRRDIAPFLSLHLPLLYVGVLSAVERDWERAARLLAAGMQPRMNAVRVGYALYRHWIPRLREELGPERARRLRDEGRDVPR